MLFNKDKDQQSFLQKLTKLTPEEFIGLARLLNVKMSIVDANTGKYTVRDAEEIMNDMVICFRHLSHKERRAILSLMKK